MERHDRPASLWEELAAYARWAPSPHNTQPARLKVVDPTRAEVHFVPERGLRVGDPQGRFTHLTFGIFVETIRIAARHRGYDLAATYLDEPLYGDTDGPHKVAELVLVAPPRPVADLDPGLIVRRRTNRHPYDDRPVPQAVVAELQREARRYGHRFHTSTDPDAVRWVKELNRDALYHDLEDDAYREELASWLRFSEAEARRTRDGLSPRALVLPGLLLKGVMRCHRALSVPVVKRATQHVYMSTMRGISTVGWIQGDFATAADWVKAGELMCRMWLRLTRHGIYWQPYGSVITNDTARAAMVAKFGMSEGEGGRDMVWLLVRLGYCDRAPVRSERLPLEEVMA